MTKNEIILIADASGISYYGMGKNRDKFVHYLAAFANLVAEHEREACAKVCESRMTPGTGSVAILNGAADAIRAKTTGAVGAGCASTTIGHRPLEVE